MVRSITGAECYVRETGKSMKAVELVESQKGCWRKISIRLIDPSLTTRTAELFPPARDRARALCHPNPGTPWTIGNVLIPATAFDGMGEVGEPFNKGFKSW